MTPLQAQIYNKAINDAISEYKNGIGSIMALRKRITVTVDHISPYQTKQEVTVDEDGRDYN